MILKIIGGLFVLASTTLLGFFYSFKDIYRISDLCEIKKALTIIASEIEYSINTISEALENTSLRLESPIKHIFFEFSKELNNKSGESSEEIWKSILEKSKKKLYLSEEDYEMLYGFGKTLGYLDKQLQLKNIKIATDYIDERIGLLNEKNEKNKKMYRSLGILGGLCIVVILF